MNDVTRRSMWRIPICIVIGIALSLGLSAFNLAPWLFFTVFIVAAVVITIAIVYIDDRIAMRSAIQPGMRVRVNLGAYKDKEGLVLGKKPLGSLPIIVLIDDCEYTTLFAQDELTQIKGVKNV